MQLSIHKKTLTAHAWWLAAEVARRHKGIDLVTCDSTLGLDGTLGIFHRKEKQLLAFLSDEVPNRAVVDGGANASWAFGWNQILDLAPRDAVMAIEKRMKLYSPHHALETNESTLVYRLIAKILGGHIWSNDSWQAYSCGIYDGESGSMISTDFLESFPTALDRYESRHGRNDFRVPAEGYWVLRQNGKEVFVLDRDAFLHFPDNHVPVPLMERFNLFARNLDTLAVNVLAELPKVG
jgi:hypothetical protein